MKFKITENLKEFVINAYVNEGISATKIAKQLNVSTATVIAFLKKNNVVVENKQNKLEFDLDIDIIPEYNKGISLKELAKKFNTSIPTISKKLKNKGIEVVNRQNIAKFNEHIFDSIDTEEKAYWLGFIFADGYISKSSYTFELSLASKDVSHLQKFNTFMQHNKNNVKVGKVNLKNKEFERCRWSVCNKHLWNVLNNYGCVPKKSNILIFPKLEIFKYPELILSFIRGYFDGDGTISIYNNKVSARFLGTELFLVELKTLLSKYSINTGNLIIDPRTPYTKILSISNKNALNFLHLIYDNSFIYLNRKYNKFLTFCRSLEKSNELLQTNIGGGCDANTEISTESKKSVPS